MIGNTFTIHLIKLLSGLISNVEVHWQRSVQIQFFVVLLAFVWRFTPFNYLSINYYVLNLIMHLYFFGR